VVSFTHCVNGFRAPQKVLAIKDKSLPMQLIGAALSLHIHAPAGSPVDRSLYVAGHRLHCADRRLAHGKPVPSGAHLRHSGRMFSLTQQPASR
jgi:hypothetical protein